MGEPRVQQRQGVTYRTEGVEQVVECPGDDDDVVDVEPEGQDHRSDADS